MFEMRISMQIILFFSHKYNEEKKGKGKSWFIWGTSNSYSWHAILFFEFSYSFLFVSVTHGWREIKQKNSLTLDSIEFGNFVGSNDGGSERYMRILYTTYKSNEHRTYQQPARISTIYSFPSENCISHKYHLLENGNK